MIESLPAVVMHVAALSPALSEHCDLPDIRL
jgi:hypothetical protein